MLPPSEVPVWCGIAVRIFIQRITEGVERWIHHDAGDRGKAQARVAKLAAIRRDVQMCDVLEIPVHAKEQGWNGSSLYMDVAPGTRDAEAVRLSAVVALLQGQVELFGQVRHLALE